MLRDCHKPQIHGLEVRCCALQVYGFGGVSCVVDNAAGVLRAHIGGQWVLTPLEQLLAEARRRQRL